LAHQGVYIHVAFSVTKVQHIDLFCCTNGSDAGLIFQCGLIGVFRGINYVDYAVFQRDVLAAKIPFGHLPAGFVEGLDHHGEDLGQGVGFAPFNQGQRCCQPNGRVVLGWSNYLTFVVDDLGVGRRPGDCYATISRGGEGQVADQFCQVAFQL